MQVSEITEIYSEYTQKAEIEMPDPMHRQGLALIWKESSGQENTSHQHKSPH